MHNKYFCKKIKALFYINQQSFHSSPQFQDLLIKTLLWVLSLYINNTFTSTVLSLWPCSPCCVVNVYLVLFIYVLFVNCLISSVPPVTVSLELPPQEPYHYKLFYTLCFCIHCIMLIVSGGKVNYKTHRILCLTLNFFIQSAEIYHYPNLWHTFCQECHCSHTFS
jgi:hypothetical protein